MAFKFGRRSRQRLNGVHPLLIKCAEKALSYGVMDATVVPYGGLRTLKDQEHLVSIRASKTLNSLHRKQSTGYGHAIDLAPYPVDWSDPSRFFMFATLMFRAANELDIPLEWGGHWRSFKDYPHYQLPRGFKG